MGVHIRSRMDVDPPGLPDAHPVSVGPGGLTTPPRSIPPPSATTPGVGGYWSDLRAEPCSPPPTGPLGPLLAAVLAIAATALLTGAMHEDGLADTVDGNRRRVNRRRARSKSCATAASACTACSPSSLSSAPSSFALSSLPPWIGFAILVATHGLSRWSVVLVIATRALCPPVRHREPGRRPGLFPCPTSSPEERPPPVWRWPRSPHLPKAATGVLVGLACGHVAIRAAFQAKLKGYTGDCLGATQQVSELGAYLGLLACL